VVYTTSGLVLVDVTLVRRSKSIRKPNFVNVSLSAAEVYCTSGLEKNKRSPYWNSSSGCVFNHITGIGVTL